MPYVLNGQLGLMTARQQLASKGYTWVATNPTPGTGVAYAQLTAWSATANGLFVVQNNNSVASGRNILLDRLTLFETATVATGTNISFEVYNETGLVVGLTAVTTRTPNNAGTADQATGAIVQFFLTGAITIPAAVGTRKLVATGELPVGVNVIKDSYVIDFGADGVATSKPGLTAARATDTARHCTQMAPVIIPPQTTSWLNCWGLGTSTPSFEYELVYNELVGL